MSTARNGVKNLPILAQGLPAVFLEGLISFTTFTSSFRNYVISYHPGRLITILAKA
jgi:hypothetical protein